MIVLHEVSKTYQTTHGPHEVLRAIDLTIERGEKVGILGHNGAGKSTLIRILSGAEMPSSGTVEHQMSVSWPLAFSGAFQGALTAVDNVRFICRIYKTDFDKAIRFVRGFSELGKFLDEPVKFYSSGMQARLAFALSLAVDFDCFLIDEVISVGDARFHAKCNDELFIKRADRSLIMVSHRADIIRQRCERAYVLHAGRLHGFRSIDDAFEFHHIYGARPELELILNR